MPKDCYSGANFFETADEACSNDSSLVRRAMDRCGGGWNEEVTSQMSSKGGGSGIVRGQSKEFLQVEVRAAGAFAAGKCSGSGAQDPVDSISQVRLLFCSQTPVIIFSCFRYDYDYSVLLIHFCLDKMSPPLYF